MEEGGGEVLKKKDQVRKLDEGEGVRGKRRRKRDESREQQPFGKQ